MTVSMYYTKMKCFWDKLDDISEVPVCVCETTCKAIKKTMELAERQRLMLFLMHLNESMRPLEDKYCS